MSKMINPNSISRIATGTTIRSCEITSQEDIRIDGDADGKILSKGRVVIGETAHVKGNIVCTNLDVSGHLEGDVCVKDTMTIKAGADYKGSVCSSRLVIELGAKFEGDNKLFTQDAFDKAAGDTAFFKENNS